MAEKDAPPPPPPSPSESGGATAVEKQPQKAQPELRHKLRKLPPYNVVLLNDDDHTYDYVIEMLGSVFGHDGKKAEQMAIEVDEKGRVIVLTTHKEKAELKRDQVMGYGADVRVQSCKGSMTAVIEPAEG